MSYVKKKLEKYSIEMHYITDTGHFKYMVYSSKTLVKYYKTIQKKNLWERL